MTGTYNNHKQKDVLDTSLYVHLCIDVGTDDHTHKDNPLEHMDIVISGSWVDLAPPPDHTLQYTILVNCWEQFVKNIYQVTLYTYYVDTLDSVEQQPVVGDCLHIFYRYGYRNK